MKKNKDSFSSLRSEKQSGVEEQFVLTDEQLIQANIPRRFWAMSRGDYFGSPKALEVCEQYIHQSKKAYLNGLGLVLRGFTDSGKTWLLAYVCRCLLSKGYAIYYTTLDDLTDWMFRPEGNERFSKKYLEADFVALDAVNTVNDGTVPAFNKFMRLRIDNAMPVLLGTSMLREPDTFGTDDDPLIQNFKESAEKFLNLSVSAHCEVNQFRLDKYYKSIKKGF